MERESGHDLEQAVVRHDDNGIRHLAEPLKTGLGVLTPDRAFGRERQGNYRDGKGALLPGGLRDHGCGAGTGAAPEAGGDENHIAPFDGPLDVVLVLEGRLLADLGDRTRAKAAGPLSPDQDPGVRPGPDKVLGVGVEGDQPRSVDTLLRHPGDRVRTAATAPDDRDLSPEFHEDLLKLLVDLYGLRKALILSCP